MSTKRYCEDDHHISAEHLMLGNNFFGLWKKSINQQKQRQRW